jgi:hypothetical protein
VTEYWTPIIGIPVLMLKPTTNRVAVPWQLERGVSYSLGRQYALEEIQIAIGACEKGDLIPEDPVAEHQPLLKWLALSQA